MTEENHSQQENNNGSDGKEELKILEARLQRALADYDNLKKQTQKEKEEFTKFANQIFIEQFIPIMESQVIILQQMQKIMEDHGLKMLNVCSGDEFDPQTMEAISSTGKGQSVEKVLSQGYQLHDKLIKPARVIVGEKVSENKASNQPETN